MPKFEVVCTFEIEAPDDEEAQDLGWQARIKRLDAGDHYVDKFLIPEYVEVILVGE